MTLGVFVTSTVAWFDISNNLIVNNLELGFSDKDKGVQVSFSAHGTKYSTAAKDILENETPYREKYPLVPVTSAYQSQWLNDSTVFDDTVPVLHVSPTDNDVTTVGFIQFPVYFTTAQDGYIYLDSKTSLKANTEENAKSASKNKISQSVLDKIERCSRVSFYSDDCGFKIYEPNVLQSSNTAFAGRLDLNPFDTYYDYNSSKEEILYGEYNKEDNPEIYHGLALSEDVPLVGDSDCFNAGTKAGVAPLDLETSISKGGLKIAHEKTYPLSEMTPPEDGQSLGNPITYCYMGEPKKVIMTVYVEGWDLDAVGAVVQASFNLNLVFTAAYMPKISK